MKAYSQDLRKKIVAALQRGMNKSEAARLFGVSLSSVKRYARMADQGRPLAPKKAPGKRPKVDEHAQRLLEVDLEERSVATLAQRSEFLEVMVGASVSKSTISRWVRRLGFTRKKGLWMRASATSS